MTLLPILTLAFFALCAVAWFREFAFFARGHWRSGAPKYAVACGLVAIAPIALVVWVTRNMVVYA